jgi:hypothetical protein
VAAPNPNYVSSIMVIDHGAVSSTTLLAEEEFLTSTLAISPDGKSLAGARTRDFALVAWPIGDYAKRSEIVPAPGERILSLWWRPKTDQLYFLHDNALATTDPAALWSHLEVWRPGVGSARVVDAKAGPALLFRFDGSAYLMVRPGSTAQVAYDVVDANSGRVLGQITNVRIAGTLLVPATAAPSPPHTDPSSAGRPAITVAPSDTATLNATRTYTATITNLTGCVDLAFVDANTYPGDGTFRDTGNNIAELSSDATITSINGVPVGATGGTGYFSCIAIPSDGKITFTIRSGTSNAHVRPLVFYDEPNNDRFDLDAVNRPTDKPFGVGGATRFVPPS